MEKVSVNSIKEMWTTCIMSYFLVCVILQVQLI